MALILKSLICITIMSTSIYCLPSTQRNKNIPQTSRVKHRMVLSRTAKRETEIDMSDLCRTKGACTNIPNYPEEEVARLIAELGDEVKRYQKDTLNEGEEEFQSRIANRKNSYLELCDFHVQLTQFKSLPDRNSTKHFVLQGNDRNGNPVQIFRTETCNKAHSKPASKYIQLQSGYKATCVQKYTLRNAVTALKGPDGRWTTSEQQLEIPSCCSFVADVTDE